MDADIAYAKEYNLKPGIALTKEQMAALTSDMGWLESTTVTVNGKTYDVLYPHVYLKAGSEKNDSSRRKPHQCESACHGSQEPTRQ